MTLSELQRYLPAATVFYAGVSHSELEACPADCWQTVVDGVPLLGLAAPWDALEAKRLTPDPEPEPVEDAAAQDGPAADAITYVQAEADVA